MPPSTTKPAKSTSKSSASKPAKSLDSGSKKSSKSAVGAPAQHNQSSRKGKKAWRKNVDIEDVEERLEEARAEERVIGKSLSEVKNEELFQIDVKGDDKIRHTLPRFSSAQLTSTKIINQRSAVPAVFSRTKSSASSDSSRKKRQLSADEKDRLLRVAKRPKKGPFNSVEDPSEYQAGHSIVELSNAVKQSGKYDPWQEEEHEEPELGLETVEKKPIKAPQTKRLRDEIELPAVAEPHQGVSYNPPVDSHRELLLKANKIEEKRLKEEEKYAEVKAKFDAARLQGADEGGVPLGMKVDEVQEESEDQEVSLSIAKKMPERKTKKQRRKAAQLLAEKRALAESAANKRRLEVINSVKSLRRSTDKLIAERETARSQRLAARKEKLKKGLAGQKLGKHKVPEEEVVVQLGEDLSESLRGLKTEGNLFRDRFLSLQQRALIEPRAPVLPKKRKAKPIEYEKHAWKQFE